MKAPQPTKREQRLLDEFASWPLPMRRKVKAWFATLPNHGSTLNLPTKQSRLFARWWKRFLALP